MSEEQNEEFKLIMEVIVGIAQLFLGVIFVFGIALLGFLVMPWIMEVGYLSADYAQEYLRR